MFFLFPVCLFSGRVRTFPSSHTRRSSCVTCLSTAFSGRRWSPFEKRFPRQAKTITRKNGKSLRPRRNQSKRSPRQKPAPIFHSWAASQGQRRRIPSVNPSAGQKKGICTGLVKPFEKQPDSKHGRKTNKEGMLVSFKGGHNILSY